MGSRKGIEHAGYPKALSTDRKAVSSLVVGQNLKIYADFNFRAFVLKSLPGYSMPQYFFD